MSANISKIYIENFRSIQKLSVDTSGLSIFVGRNDCGKSNILRALNLFFNEQTNPGSRLYFKSDYNHFSPIKKRKAKEIIVRIELSIPASYQKINGDYIVWEKRWRADGLSHDEYWGVRTTQGKRGGKTASVVEISERSNIHSLLKKIEFEYVPAIKDSSYFDTLRGRIYGIIAQVAEETFQTSSKAFERSIGEHLDLLTSEINGSLGIETVLALPSDLSHIFERLDFQSGQNRISLDSRGDGIKARHIPLILKFMGDKKKLLNAQGGSPFSFIWAYEEPENNLEFANAIQLSEQLKQFALNETAQVLLTTHSPAFYTLEADDSGSITRHHVFKATEEEGTNVNPSTSDIDESMGTLALFAYKFKALTEEIRAVEQAKIDAAQMAKQKRPKIFVEGESDRIILKKTLDVFFPTLSNEVDFETKLSGGGHSYVIDMLMGWRAHHKHNNYLPKVAGIVDGDAKTECDQWNNIDGHTKSAKCFCYPKPKLIQAALSKGFNVHASLETLYSKEVWEWAKSNGKLVERQKVGVYPDSILEKAVRKQLGNYEDDVFVGPDQEWSIFVDYEFRSEAKIPVATYLARKHGDEAETTLSPFKPVIENALKFLGLSI